MKIKKRVAILGILLLCANIALAQNGDELVIGMLDADFEMHPHNSFTVSEAQLFTAMYEGLVGYDPNATEVVPGVAERWQVSDDGRTYRFYLRANAKYWNGDLVTADHFVMAWKALLDPEKDNYYSFLLDSVVGATAYRNGTADIDAVAISAPSAQELVIELEEAAPYFLSLLAHYSLVPIHPRMYRIQDWNNFPAILSNGPFVLTHQDAQEMLLLQNRYYWDAQQVALSNIRLVLNNNSQQLADGIQNGTIDWVANGVGLDAGISPEYVIINPILGTNFFFFVATDPWDTQLVRQALALLLPWDQVRDTSLYLIPTSGLVPPISYYDTVQGISTQDPERALALLEEAGYPGGQGLPAVTILIPSNSLDRRIANLMAEAWQPIVQVDIVESAQNYYQVLKESDVTIGKFSWIGDYSDPLTFLQLWKSDSNLNDARFSNQEYDALIRESMLQSGAVRFQTLRTAEKILIDTALIMPINHPLALNVINLTKIGGWEPNLLDIHPVKFLYFKKGAPIPGVTRVTH